MFEREEVLGRDATSVFPTETKAKPMDSETVNAMLGLQPALHHRI